MALTYAPWSANGRTVNEKKIISLDLGSNLSRFEILLTSDSPVPNIAIGITLHDKNGDVKLNPAGGWFRYWERIDDSALGTGVVIGTSSMLSSHDYRTDRKDQSHVLVLSRPEKNKIIYYAGFGWEKSGQFYSAEAWDQYLSDFSRRVGSPVTINF